MAYVSSAFLEKFTDLTDPLVFVIQYLSLTQGMLIIARYFVKVAATVKIEPLCLVLAQF